MERPTTFSDYTYTAPVPKARAPPVKAPEPKREYTWSPKPTTGLPANVNPVKELEDLGRHRNTGVN